MNIPEQLIYLRRSRDLSQPAVARLAGIKIADYRNMEKGVGININRLNKALDALDGSLCIVPHKFNSQKLPEKTRYVNNYYHTATGIKMSHTLKSMRTLLKELPNVLISDNTAREAVKGLEMFMEGIITTHILAVYKRDCQAKYRFYFEKENSGKLPIEVKTKSIEMMVLEIAYKCCDIREYQMVPRMVEELLKED